ncbi:hypothetical protein HDU83_009522 [Entophlyctis luteolus]|nr:hypothetical protein HDU83_009522 [Entophlyctis luteolus]
MILYNSPHARKIQSLANLHRSRSESSAAAAAKRAKRDALRERVSALTSVVREKEEAIISLAHAVSTQEIQLNESRARLRETQRMADMIASFTEIEVGEFVSVLKEYAALIRGLLDVMTRRSNTNAGTVTNVGDILNHNGNADIDIIRNVCSVIEVEYFRPENSTPDDDVSDKMNEESEGSTKVAYDELRESHSGKLAADIQNAKITSERIAGPQLAALKSEIENLVGFVAREMHALSAVRLNDEAVE